MSSFKTWDGDGKEVREGGDEEAGGGEDVSEESGEWRVEEPEAAK